MRILKRCTLSFLIMLAIYSTSATLAHAAPVYYNWTEYLSTPTTGFLELDSPWALDGNPPIPTLQETEIKTFSFLAEGTNLLGSVSGRIGGTGSNVSGEWDAGSGYTLTLTYLNSGYTSISMIWGTGVQQLGEGRWASVDYDDWLGKTPVPEPTTFLLMGIGLVGLAGAETRRRRKKRAVDKS